MKASPCAILRWTGLAVLALASPYLAPVARTLIGDGVLAFASPVPVLVLWGCVAVWLAISALLLTVFWLDSLVSGDAPE